MNSLDTFTYKKDWLTNRELRSEAIQNFANVSNAIQGKNINEVKDIKAVLEKTLKDCQECLHSNLKERVKQHLKKDNLYKIIRIINSNLRQIDETITEYDSNIVLIKTSIDTITSNKTNEFPKLYGQFYQLYQKLPPDFLKSLSSDHRVAFVCIFLGSYASTPEFENMIVQGFEHADYQALIEKHPSDLSVFLLPLLDKLEKKDEIRLLLEKIASIGNMAPISTPTFENLPNELKAYFVSKYLENYSRSPHSVLAPTNEFVTIINNFPVGFFKELAKLQKKNPTTLGVQTLKFCPGLMASFVYDFLQEHELTSEGSKAVYEAVKIGFSETDFQELIDKYETSSVDKLFDLIFLVGKLKREKIPYLLSKIVKKDERSVIDLIKKGLFKHLSVEQKVNFFDNYLKQHKPTKEWLACIALTFDKAECANLDQYSPEFINKLLKQDLLKMLEPPALKVLFVLNYLKSNDLDETCFKAIQDSFQPEDYENLVNLSLSFPDVTSDVMEILIKGNKTELFETLVKKAGAQKALNLFLDIGYLSNTNVKEWLELLHKNGALITYREFRYLKMYKKGDSIRTDLLNKYEMAALRANNKDVIKISLQNGELTINLSLAALFDFPKSATPDYWFKARVERVIKYYPEDAPYLNSFFNFIRSTNTSKIQTLQEVSALIQIGQVIGLNDLMIGKLNKQYFAILRKQK